MKPILLFLAFVCLRLTSSFAADSGTIQAPTLDRVGVYDSRIVAYALFVQPEHQAALKARMAEARAARDAGHQERYRALQREITDEQNRVHLQVFSRAPIPEALAALGAQVDAVRYEAGVTRLVSKWDAAALRSVPPEKQIDVTEGLIAHCPMTERQQRTLRELSGRSPVPLWQARLLSAFGKM